jgi:alpha-beta hydrolase superfamily lysophospholipase
MTLVVVSFADSAPKKKKNPTQINERMEADEKSDPLFYSGKLRVATGLSLLAQADYTEQNLENMAVPFLLQHGTADRVCTIQVRFLSDCKNNKI